MSDELWITGGVSMETMWSPTYTTQVFVGETTGGTIMESPMYQMEIGEGVTLYEGGQPSQPVLQISGPVTSGPQLSETITLQPGETFEGGQPSPPVLQTPISSGPQLSETITLQPGESETPTITQPSEKSGQPEQKGWLTRLLKSAVKFVTAPWREAWELGEDLAVAIHEGRERRPLGERLTSGAIAASGVLRYPALRLGKKVVKRTLERMTHTTVIRGTPLKAQQVQGQLLKSSLGKGK
jgi:hypothetical protein